jgi:hypothetical protein
MSQEFKPSVAALKMLQQVEHMSESDVLWAEDMAMGIASTLQYITSKIENPPNKKFGGCQIIHIGTDLFPIMKSLKIKLEHNAITFDEYIKEIDLIVERLKDIVDFSYHAMVSSRVRTHMLVLANAVLVQLEAGFIINKFFELISVEV